MDNFVEPAFGQDEFRKPKVLKGWEAVAQAIITVLFGRPGFYPSIPELGMEIQQYKNKRADEIDTEAIKAALAYQFGALYSEIVNGDIDVIIRELDGNAALLIIVPIINDIERNDVVVSLLMSSDQIIYNYELIKSSAIDRLRGKTGG